MRPGSKPTAAVTRGCELTRTLPAAPCPSTTHTPAAAAAHQCRQDVLVEVVAGFNSPGAYIFDVLAQAFVCVVLPRRQSVCCQTMRAVCREHT